jgi:hypothetical protein
MTDSTKKIDQAQIDAWKEKYGQNKVKQLDLPLDDRGENFLTVYARVPDTRILSEWEKFSDKNPQKSKEILVKNCLLNEVDQVMADQDLFFSAVAAIGELIPIRKAIIKNC